MPSQTSRKSLINKDQAISLLYPIAAFFNRGGMSRAQSLAALSAAIDNVRKPQRKRELEHIGTPIYYADLIAAWTRERRFLDSRGRPRSLSLWGHHGFAALARSAGTDRDPKSLLNVLIRYRNVRKLSNGKFQLVSPFFRASAGSRMAFEPIVYFLNDATVTLTHTLKSAGTQTSPFWRTVESTQISRANAEKFVDFAKERSLIFLEEMDEWLRAHSSVRGRGGKRQPRVGLGLFSISSR
ncbi:MAG TPA: DUF6502 family protein [Steroidobacteraceae bacterium]|nr:DUF6502 family protein [Steroidobacteraceae bacterium]